MVKSGVSRNLFLQNTFQRFPRKPLKMTSNEKIANHKVLVNFLLMLIDITFIPKGIRKLILDPNYCAVQMNFEDSESW
jgi:hypothetical protein